MNVDGFLTRIHEHAVRDPDHVAVAGDDDALTYAQLVWETAHAVGDLDCLGEPAIGLLAGNGPQWAVADLAALCAGVSVVPLPEFFTDAQLRWAVERAGIAAIVTDDEDRARELLRVPVRGAAPVGSLAAVRSRRARPRELWGSKVTFTSGTTGRPKGVLLRPEALLTVAESLAQASRIGPDDRHMALLPLSVLLENVGGLYRGLLAGATVLLPGTSAIGTDGAARADGRRVLDALASSAATSAILVPRVLELMVDALDRARTAAAPTSLRFLGAGGAPVGASLLHRAWHHGLPVYEGYGLSEAASVVALNPPGAARPGSVGRVLPHAEVRIARDGEILVRSRAVFEGYLGGGERVRDWLPTGDLGQLDEDGYLHVMGRKRNAIITAFGRNVAPAWVERLLTEEASILQAAVFGDGLPQLTAVIHGDAAAVRIERDVHAANGRLPEYARIGTWHVSPSPLPVRHDDDGALHVDRDAVARRFADVLAVAAAVAGVTPTETQEAACAFTTS